MSQENTVPPPAALRSRNPFAWLVVFGPGAIIASITLGSGELIFSTRGGALFGYDILFLFVLISLLKWGLVYAMSRHMVISGVHPYERMKEVPGPRGWLLLMLLVVAGVLMPVWTSFFPGILGNFTSWVTGTQLWLNGAIDYVWGVLFLLAAVALSMTSGYTVLERIQIVIVGLMMVCSIVTLVLYNPDWLQLVEGALLPRQLHYPSWLPVEYPNLAKDTVWVETTRYVGVIGGAGFDYLAYTAWLREKHWGRSSAGAASAEQLREIADDPHHPVRCWTRAPLVDCAGSFVLVILFSAVFVASGVVVLAPAKQIPTEDNFLDMQARFVTGIHPWLLPIYIIGAYLTIFGTLYGTLEIGVTVCREIVRAMNAQFAARHWKTMRRMTVGWLTLGACVLLAWSFAHTVRGRAVSQLRAPADLPGGSTVEAWHFRTGETVVPGEPVGLLATSGGSLEVYWVPPRGEKSALVRELLVPAGQAIEPGQVLGVMAGKANPRLLMAILTPANLFTGVLSVGLFCLLMPWMDWRFLPRELRMPHWLLVLNGLSAIIFVCLGAKGYWDNHQPGGTWIQNRWFPIGGIVAVAILSAVAARIFHRYWEPAAQETSTPRDEAT